MSYLKNIWHRQYQLIIMSDEGGWTRSYLMKAGKALVLVLVLISLLAGLIIGLVLALPTLRDYDRLVDDNRRLQGYRDNVREVVTDADRYGQVSSSLLRYLELAAHLEESADSSSVIEKRAGGISIDNLYINFLENVPTIAPVNGFVTRGPLLPGPSTEDSHAGIDIASTEGEPIVAAASGMVLFSSWTEDLGNMIILSHGDGYFTIYGHNQLNLVKARQQVERGEPIGLVGNTGISRGPHLHFEIWQQSRSLDPRKFIELYRKQDISVDKNG